MEPFEIMEDESLPQLLFLSKWMQQFPRLSVGITSRIGGVSEGHYHSLNCALHVNDDDQHVIANRSSVAKSLGFDLEAWTCGEQVHGNQAAFVKKADRGRGRLSRESAFQQTDILITNVPDILLTSFYADCVPLYFFDPEHDVIALAHAGWRGTALNVAATTISAMSQKYGSKPDQLWAAIGPSIGGCCYEVDRPVIQQLRKCARASEFELDFQIGHSTDHLMLDLKDVNRQFMIKAGILPVHIEISDWCTSCNTELFYSHRKENGKTGRMASWIGLKKEVERSR